jgi:hypothetical protein
MKMMSKDFTAEDAENAEFFFFSSASSAVNKNIIRWLLVAVLLLAFGLRVHNLGAQSFWNDEGNSARLSERSIPLIIEGTASDIHPPLYYLLLNQWRKLVGDSEFGLRSLSLFAGMLTVPLTFVLGKMTGRREAQRRRRGTQRENRGFLLGFLAAALLAINPSMVYYSQEARMYALLGFWAVLTTVLLLRWVSVFSDRYSVFGKQNLLQRENQIKTLRPPRSLRFKKTLLGGAYVLSAAAGLYTHYFFPAVLFTHNIFILYQIIQTTQKPLTITHLQLTINNSPQQSKIAQSKIAQSKIAHPLTPSPLHLITRWATLMLATLLLYAPWLPIFLQQFSGDPVSRPPVGEFVTAVSHWLTFGATIELGAGFLWLLAGLLLVGLVVGRSTLILPILAVLLPLGMMFATGTTGAAFHKFLVVAVPFWLIWLTAAVAKVGKWGWLLAAGLLLLSWGMGQSLNNMYGDPVYARADYRGMAARIIADGHPNAGVILDAPNQWEVFTYYFPDEGNVYPLPAGRSRPTAEAIDAALSEIAAQHERIYVLFWGEAQRDPERLVERWLDAHAFKAADDWVGDVRFVTYAVPSAPATEMETAVNLSFGNIITLNGYSLNETTRQPGDIVEVTLFWETAIPLEQRYKIFLHLLDDQGNIVSQRDSEPGGGLALTTTWQPGQVIIDNHGLLIPSDLPPGQYQMQLGLYEVANPSNRLSILLPDGKIGAYSLGFLTVSE